MWTTDSSDTGSAERGPRATCAPRAVAGHAPSVVDDSAVRPGTTIRRLVVGESGSMVSEYGLVAVLGATIAGLAISWAKGGAVASLLAAVLSQLRAVVLA